LIKQRGACHMEVQRARLALLLYRHSEMSSPEAARRLGQSPQWVYQWRRRWVEDGFSLTERARRGRPRVYSSVDRAMVIAVACELPSQRDLPLSRHFASSIREVLNGEGIGMSLRSVQRVLAENVLKPWRYRSWIHPRDPEFKSKAERVLGLYEGVYEGSPLEPGDMIVSADEKTSIQCRRREVTPPAPGEPGHVESDYERGGAFQYLCAWDVRRGKPYGRCEGKTGIAPFGRLVRQVMTREPYRSAQRVFWIVDNGSSHRGRRAVQRLEGQYPNLVLVHTPVHASWLSQIEIFFSIVQRKVLTPAAAESITKLRARVMDFEVRYRRKCRPFKWKFTRADFRKRLRDLAA